MLFTNGEQVTDSSRFRFFVNSVGSKEKAADNAGRLH